jgi:hypothetical protein
MSVIKRALLAFLAVAIAYNLFIFVFSVAAAMWKVAALVIAPFLVYWLTYKLMED